ncbi:MAG: response regulator [Candidatus Polarisedimenticolaceae bacterium]|nr:response regulator [Candidatus Polarisedimenticolaceae bacterium]
MCEANILLIEQCSDGLKNCKAVFGDSIQIFCAKSAEEAVELVKQQHIDLILLQVEGEAESAFETCRQLKVDQSINTIPVIFMSEQGSFNDKILSYEAGAYDFIIKPYTSNEGLARIRFIQKRRETERQLSEEAKLATETALSAMAGSSELGQAIRFVEQSYDAKDYEALAKLFMTVPNNLNLNCSLLFETHRGDLYFSSNEKGSSPLEKKLMKRFHQEGKRFQDFAKRTIINYPRVQLLIKNMPLDDEVLYGRYKDLFPAMLGAADAKVKALDIQHALLEQTRSVSSSFDQVRETLTNLSAAFMDNQSKSMNSMRAMLTDLDQALPSMGLEEDQEKFLMGRVDSAVEEASELMDQGENLNAAFHSISTLLDFLSEQQKELTECVMVNANLTDDAQEGDIIDIELF